MNRDELCKAVYNALKNAADNGYDMWLEDPTSATVDLMDHFSEVEAESFEDVKQAVIAAQALKAKE